MRNFSRMAMVAAAGGLLLASAPPASSQTRSPQSRDPIGTSLDTRPQTQRRQNLQDNCYSGIATDRTVDCAVTSGVGTPLPSLPCTSPTTLQNPALGPLPNTCQ